jgi:hypothetical protein
MYLDNNESRFALRDLMGKRIADSYIITRLVNEVEFVNRTFNTLGA